MKKALNLEMSFWLLQVGMLVEHTQHTQDLQHSPPPLKQTSAFMETFLSPVVAMSKTKLAVSLCRLCTQGCFPMLIHGVDPGW